MRLHAALILAGFLCYGASCQPPELPPRPSVPVEVATPNPVRCNPTVPPKPDRPAREVLKAADPVGFVEMLWSWWDRSGPYVDGLEIAVDTCRGGATPPLTETPRGQPGTPP